MVMQAVCSSLDEFMGKIELIDFENNADDFFKVMLEFRQFISHQYEEGELNEFFESPEFGKYKAYFHHKNVLYLKGVEILEVEKRLSEGVVDIEQVHIRASYLGKKEDFSMLGVSTLNAIAIVGAGAYSETVIYCHEHLKIENVVAIDYDEKAINSASKLAEFMKLDRLNLLHIDARQYNYEGMDAVYLTGFSHPKSEILERVAETSKAGTQVLVENCTHHLQKLVYDDFEIDERRFKVKGIKTIVTPYHYRTVAHLRLL